MKRVAGGILAVVLLLVIAIFVLVEARMKSPYNGGSEYDCVGGAWDDPVCVCIRVIGDEGACTGKKTTPEDGGEETVVSWGTECKTDAALCVAWTVCEDGTRLQCLGEYKASADEAGVRCLDSGSDNLPNQEYCQD